jgi:hypothetical protein
LGDALESQDMLGAYIASPVNATPLGIGAVRAYQLEGAQIVIAWTRWRLVFEAGALKRFAFGGHAQVTVQCGCEGAFQLWLRMRKDGQDILDAQVTAARDLEITVESPPITRINVGQFL